MNLLSNLLEFSNYQPTSLMFCESPKEVALERNAKELRTLMSARKEDCTTPERKPASKSLSKLDLLSLSQKKIDPRERLLHRMVHKINMKCRKHYYNFFVVLENLKKNNLTLNQPKPESSLSPQTKNGLIKLFQLQQILYSKYFQHSLKKTSFRNIAVWGRCKVATGKLERVLSKRLLESCFKQLSLFSKRKEKNEIRMDILLDSILHIDRAITNFHRIIYLQTFMSNLKASSCNVKATQVKKPELFRTPPKVAEPEAKNVSVTVKPFTETQSPFSKDKTSLMNSSHHLSYQNLKNRKRINDESPGKTKAPISLTCTQVKLKVDKCYNFIKNTKVKTNLFEETLPANFSKEPQYQISKRCEPIALITHEVPDLNDRGTIFFNQMFSNHPSSTPHSNFQIAESSVQNYTPLNDAINETLSEDLRSKSQLTLIAPLSENYYEQSRKSISSSGVKGSAFGSQAVNFKNSLVVERELMKNQAIQEKMRDSRKEGNFAKVKNQVKTQKKNHDEYIRESEYRLKNDYRYESAEKDYNPLKYRREGDFSISIPQGFVSQSAATSSRNYNLPKRSCDTPDTEPTRSIYNSERKHLSMMNNNKIYTLQQENKKSLGTTYLNILSKK